MTYKTNPERYLRPETISKIEELVKKIIFSDKIEVTYVFSDLHGCLDKFIELLEDVVSFHKVGVSSNLVFLGDYIDRGPDSLGVIAAVRLIQEIAPDKVVALTGNHEIMFLNNDYVNGISRYDNKLSSGYFDYIDVDSDVRTWMYELPFWHEDKKHYYVHAGFRPGVKIGKQKEEDMVWIREEFLRSKFDFGKHVFHGHTPVYNVDIQAYHTNIDTGGVFGGMFTCAEIIPHRQKANGFHHTEGFKRNER